MNPSHISYSVLVSGITTDCQTFYLLYSNLITSVQVTKPIQYRGMLWYKNINMHWCFDKKIARKDSSHWGPPSDKYSGICVSDLYSGIGFWPVPYQAITSTHSDLLSIVPLGTISSAIGIKKHVLQCIERVFDAQPWVLPAHIIMIKFSDLSIMVPRLIFNRNRSLSLNRKSHENPFDIIRWTSAKPGVGITNFTVTENVWFPKNKLDLVNHNNVCQVSSFFVNRSNSNSCRQISIRTKVVPNTD